MQLNPNGWLCRKMNERYHYALGLAPVPQNVCDVVRQAAAAIGVDLAKKALVLIGAIISVIVLVATNVVGYVFAPFFGYVPPRLRIMVPVTDEEFVERRGKKSWARFYCGFASEKRAHVTIAGKKVVAFWPLAIGYMIYVACREVATYRVQILWFLGLVANAVASFFTQYGEMTAAIVAGLAVLAAVILGLFVVIPAIGRGVAGAWHRFSESEIVRVLRAYARSFEDKTCVLVEYQGEFPDIEKEDDDTRLIRLDAERPVSLDAGVQFTVILPTGERLGILKPAYAQYREREGEAYVLATHIWHKTNQSLRLHRWYTDLTIRQLRLLRKLQREGAPA